MQIAAMKDRALVSEGAEDEADFSISLENAAHLMWVLRTGLYERKALAVEREYSANGWDANRSIGHGHIPLDIHIPTHNEPYFSVRDQGPGLDRYALLHAYTAYGWSDKRGADPNCPKCGGGGKTGPGGGPAWLCPACQAAEDRSKLEVGALGIGCKCGFCIGDTFTVTSWHNGLKMIGTAALDESNKGKMVLMDSSEYDEDEIPSGVEIKVPVPASMIMEFQREARTLFRYMEPRPNININLPAKPTGVVESGWVSDKDHYNEWVAVMGCIPYSINAEALTEELRDAGIYEAVEKLGGGLYVPIGEVDFAANREGLQYTKKTKAALAKAIKQLLQDYFNHCLAALDNDDICGWDKRAQGRFLVKRLGFPVPKRYNEWTREAVKLWAKEKGEKPKTFILVQDTDRRQTDALLVNNDTTILLMDDPNRKFKGYQVHKYDVVAMPLDGKTVDVVRAEVEQIVKAANCDGVKIESLKDARPWYNPTRSNSYGRVPNQKHRERTFKLVGTDTNTRALSENWEITEPPTDEHVYFIINAFRVRGSDSFYRTINKDRAMARSLGLDFPEVIYGYKTTAKAPVSHDDIDNGTSYFKWRKQHFASQMTPKRKALMRELAWAEAFENVPYRYRMYTYNDKHQRVPNERNFTHSLPALVARMERELGAKHPFTRMFAKHLEAKALIRRTKGKVIKAVRDLAQFAPSWNSRSAAECHKDRLLARYPMLGLTVEDLDDLCMVVEHLDIILPYIKSVDGAQD